MKTLKLRYKDADGKYLYKELTFPSDVELYTNKRDANGKEIYVGDVLHYEYVSFEASRPTISYDYEVYYAPFATTEDGHFLMAGQFSTRELKE